MKACHSRTHKENFKKVLARDITFKYLFHLVHQIFFKKNLSTALLL